MNRASTPKLLRAVSALFTAAALAACGSGDPSAMIASAKAYIAKSDYKSGAIQLKSALQQNPDNSEARFLLAKALLASGDAAGAQGEARKALELKYPADEAYPLLGVALLAQGDYKKLVSELGEVRLGTPEARASVGGSLAAAYLALGDARKAQATLDAALSEAPSDPRLLTAAAQMDIAKKDSAAANKHLDAALAAAPDNVEALTLKASLLADQGKIEDARKMLERAVEIQPAAISARVALVSLLINSGQVDKAALQVDAM